MLQPSPNTTASTSPTRNGKTGRIIRTHRRDPDCALAPLQLNRQMAQRLVEPSERVVVKRSERIRQARKGARRLQQHLRTERAQAQPRGSAIGGVTARQCQTRRDHGPDQIAGSALVDVHRPGKATHPDVRLGLNHAQRPDLCAADAGHPLDLLEMGPRGIEDRPKLAQHPRHWLDPRGSSGRSSRFWARGLADGYRWHDDLDGKPPRRSEAPRTLHQPTARAWPLVAGCTVARPRDCANTWARGP